MAKAPTFGVLEPFCHARPVAETSVVGARLHATLMKEGRFLPPLLVLDVLAALQCLPRGLTSPAFDRRPSSAGWGELLTTLTRRARGSRGLEETHALSVLRAMQDNLSRSVEGWGPEKVRAVIALGQSTHLSAQLASLAEGGEASLPWARLAEQLDTWVSCPRDRERIVPFSASFRHAMGRGASSVSLGLQPGAGLPRFDSQLDSLIREASHYQSQSEIRTTPLPRGPDSGHVRHYAGDFLERAPGPMPHNLAEVSPSDLVLVAPVADADQRLRKTLRLRFAQKAGEGDIHQRFHSQLTPGQKGRRVSVRVILHDREAARDRSNRVAGYLPVSLCRTVGIFFLYHLSQILSRPNPPECEVTLEVVGGPRDGAFAHLPSGFHRVAGETPRRAAEAVWACLPTFFSAESPQLGRRVSHARAFEPSYELHLGAVMKTTSARDGERSVICVDARALTGKIHVSLPGDSGLDPNPVAQGCIPEDAYGLGRRIVDIMMQEVSS